MILCTHYMSGYGAITFKLFGLSLLRSSKSTHRHVMLATSAATLPIAIPMLLNLNCVRCSAFFQWTSKTLIHSMYIVSIISIAAVWEWAGSQKVYKIVPDKKHRSAASATSILSVKNCNNPMMLIIWCVPRTVTFWKKNAVMFCGEPHGSSPRS